MMIKLLSRNRSSLLACVVLALLLFMAGHGCSREKPLQNPLAARCKQEVQETSQQLSHRLIDAVSEGEKEKVLAFLGRRDDESTRTGDSLEYIITVLDCDGVMMASRPAPTAGGLNYSRYEAVKEAYKKKRTVHLINYLQDGSRWYSTAMPLIKNDHVVGLLVLSYDSQDAHRKYGLTDQGFQAIDFNR
jgi:hypothetical protein